MFMGCHILLDEHQLYSSFIVAKLGECPILYIINMSHASKVKMPSTGLVTYLMVTYLIFSFFPVHYLALS